MAGKHLHALPNGHAFEGYRIDGILGTGGFGITYKARETEIDRVVAIKEFLPAGLAARDKDEVSVRPISRDDEDQFAYGLDRFREEAKTLVNFHHPNIVPVHRYFAANGTAYLVMHYVEGDSLGEILKRDRTLSEPEIFEILHPLLDGLERVHRRGFLHRDVKPDNIIIGHDGVPVLLDFGSARHSLGERSQNLTAIVTRRYAPFEQYSSRGKQGPWTDFYSLGATLYRAIAGVPPPEATSRIDHDDLVPAIEAGAGDYDAALLAAIDRALAPRAKDRPQTAAEFRALLAPRPASGAGEADLDAQTPDAPPDPDAPTAAAEPDSFAPTALADPDTNAPKAAQPEMVVPTSAGHITPASGPADGTDGAKLAAGQKQVTIALGGTIVGWILITALTAGLPGATGEGALVAFFAGGLLAGLLFAALQGIPWAAWTGSVLMILAGVIGIFAVLGAIASLGSSDGPSAPAIVIMGLLMIGQGVVGVLLIVLKPIEAFQAPRRPASSG